MSGQTLAGPLWLVRARLRREASVAALAPLLMPEDEGMGTLADHRLVWSLMTPGEDATRDFLWRREERGRFLVLAPRPPADGSALFDVECKPFEPVLAPGDRLRFALRANPTTARLQPGQREQGRRGTRGDVVMHALHAVPKGERAEARPRLMRAAGTAWLARQGEQHGFRPETASLDVDGYRRLRVPRAGSPPIQVGMLDYEGLLTVEDPAAFLAGLARGFGRARAFGCGLMLIRRA